MMIPFKGDVSAFLVAYIWKITPRSAAVRKVVDLIACSVAVSWSTTNLMASSVLKQAIGHVLKQLSGLSLMYLLDSLLLLKEILFLINIP